MEGTRVAATALTALAEVTGTSASATGDEGVDGPVFGASTANPFDVSSRATERTRSGSPDRFWIEPSWLCAFGAAPVVSVGVWIKVTPGGMIVPAGLGTVVPASAAVATAGCAPEVDVASAGAPSAACGTFAAAGAGVRFDAAIRFGRGAVGRVDCVRPTTIGVTDVTA